MAQLSDQESQAGFERCFPIHWPGPERFEASGIGTVAAPRVALASGQDPFIAVSRYVQWRQPRAGVGVSPWILGDAPAHRIIPELSAFANPREGSAHHNLAADALGTRFADRFDNEARLHGVLTRMNALWLDCLEPPTPGVGIANAPPAGPQAPVEPADADGPHVHVARVQRPRARAGDARSRPSLCPTTTYQRWRSFPAAHEAMLVGPTPIARWKPGVPARTLSNG
ncbi:MAG: hypothetical protein OXF79_00985 [Chloroflexi bacterium]|nr:hypothetical protein [Chloroflexota bacterium]